MIEYLNIKKSEFKLVFLISLIVTILTTAPYLYGYFNAPPGQVYLGIHLAPSDIFVYESYIGQVKEGNILLQNLFHNELPTEKNFNVFWLALGWMAKMLNLSPLLALHIFRIILIPICLSVIYLLIAYFLNNLQKRKIAFTLIAFTSGLGGILAPVLLPFQYLNIQAGKYYWPMDLWVAESNTFLTFYHSPHFIASLIFLLSIFLFFLLSLNTNKIKYTLIAGILALFYFNFHPFYLVTIFSVIFIYLIILLFRKQKKAFLAGIKYLAIIGFISLPSILYHALKVISDPLTKQKALQNICQTPPPIFTVIGYGIPLFLAIYGIYYLIKTRKVNNKNLFLITWLIINFILIYLPFLNFQRRLTEGMQIPLAILGTIGIFALYKEIHRINFIIKIKQNKYLSSLLLFFALGFLFSSNLYVLSNGIAVINEKIPYFKNTDIEAMNWLKENISKEKTILSHPNSGNIIPAISLRKVYAGHWVETLNYQNKTEKILWFFADNNKNQEKKEFLENSRIDYIFYSNFEKNLGGFNPDEKDYLQKIYNNKEISIYKVIIF